MPDLLKTVLRRGVAFATGAGVALAGVWALRAFNGPDEATLLHGLLRDHCLPWVTDAVTPFADVGQPVSPAEMMLIDDPMRKWSIGARRIADGRFEAAWGATTDSWVPSRLCLITAAETDGFAVPPGSLVTGLTEALAGTGLKPENPAPVDGPTVIGWVRDGDLPYTGLRLVIVAAPGRILSAQMVDDQD
ncbi:hypothetical protein [Ruixingdingia sedimenti]|uniref:Uncharacterized protein n=1 Tax=Ruixingdingia sedimenti TaxID=3073604 RepID=A0ABU1FA35_9RHOB|nr:hypothetical protein [Xinfangfangia sp. LG-4]MDR5653443.1 hypothetical protein [Xinfangfangia sp. LG-4]